MSSEFGGSEFGEIEFGGESSGGGGSTGGVITITIDGVDETERLCTNKETGNKLNIVLGQDGNSADIWLNYSDLATLPPIKSKFVITLSNGRQVALVTMQISRPTERIHSETVPVWIHEFKCVDPITALFDEKLPVLDPFLNTNTGAILTTLLSAFDGMLNLNIAAGNDVSALNLREFSNFGDILRSEIMSGGYVLRMEDGFNVRGDFDTNFSASSDWTIDQTDYRYTPTRFRVDPPEKTYGSVTVSPTKEVPLFRGSHFIVADARVQSSLLLDHSPFGLLDADPFGIGAGVDVGDPDLWRLTGSINTAGSHILLNGSLVHLEAKPFVAPYKVAFRSILPTTGTAYQFGFQTGSGVWIWSVSSADYPLTQHVGQHLHEYEIFTVPVGNVIAVWGAHLDQDFGVDGNEVISTVTNIDEENNTVTLATGWNINNSYIRFMDTGVEVGRVRILKRQSGNTVLTLEAIPPKVAIGNEVTRGLEADAIITFTLIKTVTIPANSEYGLPALTGSGVHIGQFSINKSPQIEGFLVDEFNKELDQSYPRALKIDDELTQFTDVVISGSGSSSIATIGRKFVTDKRVELIFNYVVGGKKDFPSTCSGDGGHLTVPVDNEQDPATLQALAERLCSIVSNGLPRIKSDMHSTEVLGTPLPFDPLPLNLPGPYRVTVDSIPVLTVRISFKGVRVSSSGEIDVPGDVVLYDVDAGSESALERARKETLRGRPLTKYPLRFATTGGARLVTANWDEETETLTGSISGGGVLIGPFGQVLDLAGGFNPFVEAGIADKHTAPVTIRCTIDGGNDRRDAILFTVIYKPQNIDPNAVTCEYNGLTNLITYRWPASGGSRAYEIERIIDDDEETPEFKKNEIVLGREYPMPYEPLSKTIRIRSIGLCDMKSDWAAVTCTLPPIPAPVLTVRKVKPNNIIVLSVGALPTGDHITGRIRKLKLLVRQTDGTVVIDGREDFPEDSDDVETYTFDVIPDVPNRRIRIKYDDTNLDDEVWIYPCWIDGFGDESEDTEPFDATNPPMTVGKIYLHSENPTKAFFQFPTPGDANNQTNGGTVEDDDETTTLLDFSGKFRVEPGLHNVAVQVFFQEAASTVDGSIGAFATNKKVRSGIWTIKDSDINNGYVDIDVLRKFRWGKKVQRWYRPTEFRFLGASVRERIGSGVQFTQKEKFLIGNDTGTGTVVENESDAYFNRTLFQFKPGAGGLANNYPQINVTNIVQQQNGFLFKWRPFNDSSIRRYIVLIHTADFGTKGPGTDSNIDAQLDSFVGEGTLTVYDPTNTTRNVTVQARDVFAKSKELFQTSEVFGSITITPGTQYFVSVIAQTKAGRWSSDFSDPLSSISGQPVNDPITDAPSAPSLVRIITNQPNLATTVSDAELVFRVNASNTDPLKTFQQVNTKELIIVATPIGSTKAEHLPPFVIDDLTVTSVDITHILTYGKGFTWNAVIAANGNNKLKSTASGVTFFAGARQAAAGIPELTTFNFSVVKDGKQVAAALSFTQPAGTGNQVLLSHAIIRRKVTGTLDSTYKKIKRIEILNDSDYITAGLKVIDRDWREKANTNFTYQIILFAAGGAQRLATTTLTTDDELNADTDVPTGLGTPTLQWNAKGSLEIVCQVPTTNIATLKDIIVVLTDNAITPVFYNFATKSGTSSEVTARYRIGRSGVLPHVVKIKKLYDAFNGGVKPTTTKNLFAYYYAENSIGISVKSNLSTPIDLSTQQDVWSATRESISIVDVGSIMISPGNVIENGHLTFGRSANPLRLREWEAFVSNVTVQEAITTTSSNVSWNQNMHRMEWVSNSRKIRNKIGARWVPGEFFALTWWAKTNSISTPFSTTIRTRLVDDNNIDLTVDENDLTAVAQVTMPLTGNYIMGHTVMRLSTSYIASRQLFFTLETPSPISGSLRIELDAFMFARGRVPQSWCPKSKSESSDISGTEDWDIIAQSIGVPPDLGNPTGGAQGGGTAAGGGVVLQF